MNLSEFIQARRVAWANMEDLIGEVEKRGVDSLGSVQGRRFADLYRRVSSDLVQARTYGAGVELTEYLESLVARAFAHLYPSPALRLSGTLRKFLLTDFPQTVRRESRPFLLVVTVFLAGLILGGLATSIDSAAARLFVPAEHQDVRPRDRVQAEENAARTGARILGPVGHAAFSSFLFTHNITVSITAFAVGIALGLPTLLLIAFHGVFIAALGVEYFRDGVGLFFLAWILPHGVIELTSMFLAGTAGLLLGRGVLWPRGMPRGQRVREEAQSALVLLGGAAVLLVVAGVIEGTISQIHEPTLPYTLKIGLAGGLGLLLYGYLWLLPVWKADSSQIPSEPAPLHITVQSSPNRDRVLVVRTPEEVVFTYPLAGPVERLCAYVLDLLCIGGLMTAVAIACLMAGTLGLPVLFVALFLVQWGYFVWFEWRWNGLTPGKSMMGIRVLQMNGVRCGLERLLVRNFLRVVDALPLSMWIHGTYALGGAVALVHPRGARLGDLVAGTVCVRRPRPLAPASVMEIRTRHNSLREDVRARTRIRQLLTPEESHLVVSLAMRHGHLEERARLDLDARVALYLRGRLRIDETESLSDESLVLNVASVLLEDKGF